MRGPIGYLITLTGKAKKNVFTSSDALFSLKISVKSEKRSSLSVIRTLIFSEVPHFLRGPRLQPAWPRNIKVFYSTGVLYT